MFFAIVIKLELKCVVAIEFLFNFPPPAYIYMYDSLNSWSCESHRQKSEVWLQPATIGLIGK